MTDLALAPIRPFRPAARSGFGADRRGTVAVLTGLMILPLMFSAGIAVDLTRATGFRTALQNAADSAALAGAAAYTDATQASAATAAATAYLQQAEAGLPSNRGVSFTVTPAVLTNAAGQTTGYTVAVTAQAQVPTTLMSLVVASMPAIARATAENPVVTVTATLGNWKSSAADANTIYWYVVPQNGALPAAADLHQLFTNTGPAPTTLPSIQLTAAQKIGFALKNVTGGIHGYGANQYGSPQGHTNWLYSQLAPPSASAYPTEPRDCALEVAVATAATPTPTQTAGSCVAATPALGTISCTQAAGQTVFYFWNDMGGTTDDYDYNDAQYSLSCSAPPTTQTVASAAPTTVVLTN